MEREKFIDEYFIPLFNAKEEASSYVPTKD